MLLVELVYLTRVGSTGPTNLFLVWRLASRLVVLLAQLLKFEHLVSDTVADSSRRPGSTRNILPLGKLWLEAVELCVVEECLSVVQVPRIVGHEAVVAEAVCEVSKGGWVVARRARACLLAVLLRFPQTMLRIGG